MPLHLASTAYVDAFQISTLLCMREAFRSALAASGTPALLCLATIYMFGSVERAEYIRICPWWSVWDAPEWRRALRVDWSCLWTKGHPFHPSSLPHVPYIILRQHPVKDGSSASVHRIYLLRRIPVIATGNNQHTCTHTHTHTHTHTQTHTDTHNTGNGERKKERNRSE